MTSPGAGQFYRWLDEAVPRAGSQRSLDSQDTTLSRRGLLIRADKRARELASLKVGAGDIVALSMGNVAEFVILLLAVSKLGAVAMPVDPANGDRSLLGAAARLPVRAVLRRPRGLENSPLQYPEGYRLGARRKLSGSLLEVDILDVPEDLAQTAASPATPSSSARPPAPTEPSTTSCAPAPTCAGSARPPPPARPHRRHPPRVRPGVHQPALLRRRRARRGSPPRPAS
jgi:acyl-CoA synthetase (AMP-forming)/AMP-acid ligase II